MYVDVDVNGCKRLLYFPSPNTKSAWVSANEELQGRVAVLVTCISGLAILEGKTNCITIHDSDDDDDHESEVHDSTS